MNIKKIFAVTLLGTILTSAHAEVAVIVSPNANINKIDQDLVARLFLGKASSLPNDTRAIAIDMKKGSRIYNEFSESILEKTPSQLSSYWSRLIFTGRSKPNRQVNSAKEMKELISKNKNMIGYIDTKDVDNSVVVVLKR